MMTSIRYALAVLSMTVVSATAANAQIGYRITDAGDIPMSQITDQNLQISLSRIDPTGNYEQTVAACWPRGSSDVWPDEGCTDYNGEGLIVAQHIYNQETGTYDSSPLTSGRYDLAVYGSGKLLARRSVRYIVGSVTHLGTIKLQNSPVKVSLAAPYLQTVPSSGGSFTASFNLEHNVDYVDTPFTVMVEGTISSPGITAYHTQRGLPSQKIVVHPGQLATFTSEPVTVPAEIPDGSWVCVNIFVSHPERVGVTYGGSSGCAVKGRPMAFMPGTAQ